MLLNRREWVTLARMFLDSVGTPVGVQQKLMRHADIRTTLNRTARYSQPTCETLMKKWSVSLFHITYCRSDCRLG